MDGTSAIRLVAGVWARLSAAQKAAIDRDLGASHDGGSVSRSATAASLTPDPGSQATAEKYNAIYRTKMPFAPPVTIRAFRGSGPLPKNALADALPISAIGAWGIGTPAYCRVRVAPSTFGKPAQYLDEILAHEVFHCYQFVLDSGWEEEKQWVSDGTAEWAAETVTGFESGWLDKYLSTVDTPLFARTYDAMGFFGHADEVGGRESLFAKMRGILTAHDNAATFAAAGGTAARFYETWGSAAWRLSGAGAAWTQTDPLALSSDNPSVPRSPVSSNAFVRSSRTRLVNTSCEATLTNRWSRSSGMVRCGPARPVSTTASSPSRSGSVFRGSASARLTRSPRFLRMSR